MQNVDTIRSYIKVKAKYIRKQPVEYDLQNNAIAMAIKDRVKNPDEIQFGLHGFCLSGRYFPYKNNYTVIRFIHNSVLQQNPQAFTLVVNLPKEFLK